MKTLKSFLTKIKIIHIILAAFFILNTPILSSYPFVHSDEAWLSGLSRHMLESRSFAVTEAFFDLLPRNPHAVKIFFHSLQMGFMKIFTYRIFTFRLISLITAVLSLYLFYKIANKITNSNFLALSAVLMLGIDIHFIYSSHMARQEIILVMIFLAAFLYLLRKEDKNSAGSAEADLLNADDSNKADKKNNKKYKSAANSTLSSIKKDILLALILASAIGIHPNSFTISLPFILIYSYNLILNRRVGIKNYIAFGSTLAISALFFVYLSFQFDPNFISNYLSYGENLGVLNSLSTKLDRLDYFYQKIFYRVSGTYYIPPVKIQFIIFAATALLSLFKLFVKRKKLDIYLILSLIGINAAFIIIGRYNQTGIIFIFPIFYLLILSLLKDISVWNIKIAYTAALILIILISVNTFSALRNDSFSSYQDYLNNIAQVVDSEDRVLANLNTAYYFERKKLFDYRNLAYLDENDLSFADYIEKNKIEYIIYPEEMDFIYNSRPQWNIIYGNLYPYYEEMKNFIENNTVKVYEFSDKTYAMRIVRYIGQKDWSVKIYKVKNGE